MRRLDAVWDLILASPARQVAVGLLLLAVLRSGIAVGRFDVDDLISAADALPTPAPDWRSNSVLPLAAARLVGADVPWRWYALHGLLIVGVAVVAIIAVRRRFPTASGRRLAGVWLSLGSLPPVLLQRVGSYDPWTVGGIFVAVFGSGPASAVAGGVVLGLTSAEQGILGLVSAAAVLAALARQDGGGGRLIDHLRGHPTVQRLAVAAASLLLARVAVLAWFAVQGADVPSRGSVLGDYLGEAVSRSVAGGLAGISGWLGLGWAIFLLGALVGNWSTATTVRVVAATVGPAALATVITLDGTRVFVAVSLPAVLVLLAWVVERVEQAPAVVAARVHRLTAAALLVAPLVPSLVLEPSGGWWIPLPWML